MFDIIDDFGRCRCGDPDIRAERTTIRTEERTKAVLTCPACGGVRFIDGSIEA